MHEFSRTELLIGKEALEKLKNSKIAIFGVGGVGGFVVEGLARCGIANFVLIDNDDVNITNINRQIVATHKTIGKAKVDIAKERILDINENAIVKTLKTFYLPENADSCLSSDYDYIVDAIDTVTAKIDLVIKANSMNIPIISCMGTGNKLNPMDFKIADIYDTSICPLCKVMRHELKKRDVKNLKVLYSQEEPIKPDMQLASYLKVENRRSVPGSISFSPSVAGLIIASEVVKDIIGWKK